MSIYCILVGVLMSFNWAGSTSEHHCIRLRVNHFVPEARSSVRRNTSNVGGQAHEDVEGKRVTDD
eukprot:scaffold13966_cov110-Skeletonema_dohrnii-CCMP3373.AAC.5